MHKRSFLSTLTMLAALVFALATRSSAQVPRLISFQGLLLDDDGNHRTDGSYLLTFALYDSVSAGEVLWTESQSVAVKDGAFSVNLGASEPLALAFDRPYWLGTSLPGAPEMTPRIALTAAPYSLNSALSSGIQEIQNTGGSLEITNPSGPMTIVNVKDGGITSAKLDSGAVVRSLNGLTDGVVLEGTGDLSVTKDEASNTLKLDVTQAGDGHSLDAEDGAPQNVVFVDSDGKVGVGTVVPTGKLHIFDSTNLPSQLTTSTAAPFKIQGSSTALLFDSNQIESVGGIMYLNQRGNDVVIGASGAKVGIGTTNADAKLNVEGDLRVTGKINGGKLIAYGTTQGGDCSQRCINILSSVWNASDGRWEIGVGGINANVSLHPTVVTVVGGNAEPVMPSVTSGGGKLWIYLRNAQNEITFRNINFAVYSIDF